MYSHCYGWKRKHDPIQSKNIKQTIKHGGKNIKLWICITYYRVGYMVKIDNKLDQMLYQKILKEDLIKTIEEYELDIVKIIF